MTDGGAPTAIAVADRLELLELHARLAGAIDFGDAGGWGALFTEDGVLRTSRGTVLQGRVELARFAGEWFERHSGRYRHATWNHRFEARGKDDAEGTCYAAVLRSGGGDVAIEFTAFYRDRFRRRPEGWLLHERDVAIDRTQPEGD